MAQTSTTTKLATNWRWWMCVLLFVATTVNYMDRQVLSLTWKDFILAAVAFVFIIVQVWLSLTMPDYMSEITKLVQTKGSKMNDILIAGGKMLACALGSLLAAV